MPSLDIQFLKLLKDDYKKFNVFVETGTYLGNTIFSMEPHFNTLYTIEIKPEFHYETKSKYSGSKINFLLGDSSLLLEDLTKNILESAIFFLDGHWSAGDTGRGLKDCPLYEELHHIKNNFKAEAIIIIDDFRLFGTGPMNKNKISDAQNLRKGLVLGILKSRFRSFESTATKENEICDWNNIRKEELLDILKSRTTDVYHLPSDISPVDRLIIHIKKEE